MTRDELKTWREAKRWTQTEAANALGYSRRGYQDIEQGERPVSTTLELAVAGYEARQERRVQSVEHMTIGDLTDEQNLKDCEHAFERAATDAALADWARKWGRALFRFIREGDQSERLAEAEEAADQAEKSLEQLKSWVGDTLRVRDNLSKDDDAAVPAALDDALGLLEQQL